MLSIRFQGLGTGREYLNGASDSCQKELQWFAYMPQFKKGGGNSIPPQFAKVRPKGQWLSGYI
jgi:hypothetical protein